MAAIRSVNESWPRTSEPSGSAIVPPRVVIAGRPRVPSIGAEPLRQQTREARQINQIEGVFLAGEHRDGGALERVDVFPGLVERQVMVLRDGGESQLDQKSEPANHFVLMLDLRCAIVIGH